MIRYNIDGEYLVPFKSEVFTITKRAGELGKLDVRQGDYSTTFKVPNCSENSKILRYTPELNNYSTVNNFKKYLGFIEEDGIPISNGYFQVTEFDKTNESISIKFYGGNTDWFELIKGRYVNKEVLPTESENTYLLDEFIHKYNYEGVTDSFANIEDYTYFPYAYDGNINKTLPADSPESSVYVMNKTQLETYITDNNLPINNVTIENSDLADLRELVLKEISLNVEDFMFAWYQHTIFKKIFSSFGITLNGTLFKDPTYWSTVFSTDEDLHKYLRREVNVGYQPSAGYLGTDENGNKAIINRKETPLSKTTYTGIGYDTSNKPETTAGWDGSTYTAQADTDELLFQFNVVTQQPAENGTDYGKPELRLSYTLNGVAQSPIVYSGWNNIGSSTNLSYSDRYLVKWSGRTYFPNENGSFITGVKTGDTFTFEMRNINSSGNSGDMKIIWGSSAAAGFSSSIVIADGGGSPQISPEKLLPKITQANFVKDVLIRCGAITQYNSDAKILTIDKFEDIENNVDESIDWSDKVDLLRNRGVNYTKLLGNYGRSTYLRYKDVNDKDPYMFAASVAGNLSLGDGAINIDNDMIDKEKELYTSPFSGAAQVLSFDDDFYMPYIATHIRQPKSDDTGFEYKHNPTNARAFILAPNYNFRNANNANQSGVYIYSPDLEFRVRYVSMPFAYFAKVPANAVVLNNNEIDKLSNTLAFRNKDEYTGQSLLSKNYQLQEDILNRPMYLSIFMNLNALDISRLDHMTPIYLKYTDTSGYFYVDSVEQYRGDGTPTQVNLVKIS